MNKTVSKTFRHPERGSSLIEYALEVALISVVVIGALNTVGNKVRDKMEWTATKVSGNDTGCEPGAPDYPACLD